MPSSNPTPQREDPAELGARNLPLGQRLLNAGLVSESQLDLALRERKRHGKLLGEMLIDLGFVSADAMADTLAEENLTEVVDVLNCSIDPDALAKIDYQFARKYKLLPLAIEGNQLTVAFADAFNIVAIDQIERDTGTTLKIVSATEADILEALERHYTRGQKIEEIIDRILTEGHDADLDDGDESLMVRLTDQLIVLGIKNRATDIHIEPAEKVLNVRLRIDGVLRSEVLIPKPLQSAVITRLKLLAGVNITEKRVPQDGRIRFVFGRKEIDLRVSTLPTKHGESVVMRILDSSSVKHSLEYLGLDAEDKARFVDAIAEPHGMILVTGPTGSGKTTTLYTALGLVDRNARSVFTLEDPIEYALADIRQTQIRADIGMDFASGLRALLRQDPDVILVGEIRDTETAELAVRAALTGHLVLSTLHTNDAIGVIPRLIDMGVKRFLLPPALSAVVGQRLLRKLCAECKRPAASPDPVLERLVGEGLLDEGTQPWQAVGCTACGGSGYRGRVAIYELLVLNSSFHAAIIDGAPMAELEALALASGMTPLLRSGLKKVNTGVTTIEEVLRVVR